MKNILVLVALLFSTVFAFAQHDMQGMKQDSKQQKDSIYYTCVMHPENSFCKSR